MLLIFCACAAAAIANGSFRLHELNVDAYGPYALPLAHYGISPQFLIFYFLLSEGLLAATFAIVGLIVGWRGATNRMTVFSAIALMVYGVTIPPPMHALVVSVPPLPTILVLERSIGIALFVNFLYIFPEGRFRSWWSGVLGSLVLAWALIWPFVPSINPYMFHPPWPFIAIAALLGSGIVVQLYRYLRFSTPLQKQQTKWVVYGVTTSVAGDLVFHLPWVLMRLHQGPDLVILLIHQPFFIISQLAVPISIGFSVMYYNLWEIDFVVSRTLVYGLVTTGAAVLWEAVNLTAQKLIQQEMGPSAATFSGGIATVATGIFLKPMYDRLKDAVDQKLRPEEIDVTNEYPEFTPEFRSRVPFPLLLEVLVRHTQQLFDVAGVAVYLFDDRGSLQPAAQSGMTPETVAANLPSADLITQVAAGLPVELDKGARLAVPLILRRSKFPDVLGVLVLGQRSDERGYTAQDLSTLEELGKLAGTAIYLARLPGTAVAS